MVIKLWPAGSISGAVRDEHGEPLVKATVQLLRRYPSRSGGMRWVPIPNRTSTDDRGIYRLGSRPIRLRHPDRPTEMLWSASSIRVEGRELDSGPIPLGMTDLDVTITLTDRRAVR